MGSESESRHSSPVSPPLPAEPSTDPLSRRGFLASSVTAGVAALALGGQVEEVRAQAPPAAPAGPPVGLGVIGLGAQGRAILAALSRVPGANVVAICDNYAPLLTRAKEQAPKATPVAEYKQLLDNPAVQAVVIATPTHQHREIALAAVQAGKHVYCEAPLAHTLEDARAIAQAGKSATTVFQVGQQYRANPQHLHVSKFVRGGVLGTVAAMRAQWHKKGSWRRPAPNAEREAAVNWRLRRATSPGLIGEEGIHSLDTINWFFKSQPLAVTGSGQTMLWNDGRETPDTVQCVFEYPGGMTLAYDATLANSFDGSYELAMGADAAVLLRGERAWIFKEVDAPLLGWEVYARKEQVGDSSGIALVADATKILALGKIPGKDGTSLEAGKDALYYALESFLGSIREKKPPVCGPVEGLQAAVTALKANEAILTGSKVTYQKEWFDLA